MSSEERKKILQMVADGKINAEEASTLMNALDEPADENVEVIEPVRFEESGFSEERSDSTEFDAVRRRASVFSRGFLGLGIVFTVFSAWIMFAVQQNAGLNFWFFCFAMPLMLGILLMALGAGSKSSRWLYLNVDRSQREDGPRRISLALPLPLGFASWFIRTFGSRIDGFKKTNIDEVINAINMAKNIKEPLIIKVDESDKGGERVQVFIG